MKITNCFLIKFPVLSIRYNSYLYCKPSEKYIDKNVIAPNYFIVLFSKVVIIQGTNFLLNHYVYHYRIVQVSSFVRVLSLFLQSIAVTQEIQNWLKNREPMIVQDLGLNRKPKGPLQGSSNTNPEKKRGEQAGR